MKMIVDEFEDISWHDNHIHGFSFNQDDGKSDFILDIDHIVEWSDDGFMVAPATLIFHDVTDLNFKLTWGDSGFQTAVLDRCILEIEREVVSTPLKLPNYYLWKILFNDHSQLANFGASGFTFFLKKEPCHCKEQYLLQINRN